MLKACSFWRKHVDGLLKRALERGAAVDDQHEVVEQVDGDVFVKKKPARKQNQVEKQSIYPHATRQPNELHR